MKKRIYFMLPVVLVLVVMNVAIWQKEDILANGELVYLELAPVDPRSLMQGDYMRLTYAVENESRREAHESQKRKSQERIQKSSQMVVAIDDQGIARFVRMEDGSALQDNEKRLRVYAAWGRNQSVRPNSFLFQEGHGKYYEQAKYAIFTFARGHTDNYLLTALADAARQPINPAINPDLRPESGESQSSSLAGE